MDTKSIQGLELSTELEALVGAIIDSVLALAALAQGQGFRTRVRIPHAPVLIRGARVGW